jgi:hypothetical protein
MQGPGRRSDRAARLAVAGLLAFALVVTPGRGTTGAVARSAACPTPPVTIAELVRVTEGPGGPACFGGQLLTFRAFVPALEGLGGASTYFIKPVWLDDLQGSWVHLGAGRNTAAVVAYVPPDLGRCLGPEGRSCPFSSYRNRWATVSAHFDGPVAQTCRYGGDVRPGGGAKAAIAECQEKLIVLGIGPDHLPATDTVAVGPYVRDDRSTSMFWVTTFAGAFLFFAWRWPSARRRVNAGRSA